jgi:hypothetical protein
MNRHSVRFGNTAPPARMRRSGFAVEQSFNAANHDSAGVRAIITA